ncbi:60 kDa SS-A/Ro ribonucleoprotein [Phlyctochytrium bullatum]|nr:60 kDa SS-A/Ro ribonucleoprotein [Phlyctochytrium bullatum]
MSYLSKHMAVPKPTADDTETPQTLPIPGREADMVRNSANGFSFSVSPEVRLNRFLILGSEKGSYYASEATLTAENAAVVRALIDDGKGPYVVETVVAISDAGRAAKQDAGILALAMCLRFGDDKTKALAHEAVPKVCRIPTTLFMLMEFVTKMAPANAAADSTAVDAAAPAKKKKVSPVGAGKGFGRAMRRTIGVWYNKFTPKDLAFTTTKFKNRNGWTHADLLRVAHVRPSTAGHDLVFRFITYGIDGMSKAEKALAGAGAAPAAEGGLEEDEMEWTDLGKDTNANAEKLVAAPSVEEESSGSPKKRKAEPRPKHVPQPKTYTSALLRDPAAETAATTFLHAAEALLRTPDTDEAAAAALIRAHHFAREHVPSNLLNSIAVWEALLEDMPMTAMIRNLGKMTSLGLVKPLSDAALKICESLRAPQKLKKARIHPFSVLVALWQYRQGKGLKGSLSWEPVQEVTAALNDAFYLSFDFVEPTNKRYMVCLDVSGSMTWSTINGSCLTPRDASAAMAMTFLRTEPRTHLMAFSNTLVPITNITRKDTLESVISKVSCLPAGGTDCSLPMTYALQNKIEVDVFMVFTDSETYAGRVQPVQALRKYRKEMGIPARLVVFGMVSNGFSIADPSDAGMLDVVGFDTSAPTVVSEFVLGRL